jgi:PleD family two-component response regulator
VHDLERSATTMQETEADAAASGWAERAVVLLVDDQPLIGEAIRRMLVDQPDIEYHFCSKSSLAVETAERVKPTVILKMV